MHGLAVCVGADGLLHRRGGGKVDFRAEQVAELKAQAAEGHEGDAQIGGEVGHEVDVGLGGGFAAGDGAEEAQMGDARRLKFRGVAAENREDAVLVHLERSLAYLSC